MNKYHLVTFLVLLETLSSDVISLTMEITVLLSAYYMLLYNLNYPIHIRMFVRSNEHSNPAKFVWALPHTKVILRKTRHALAFGA